MMIEIKSETVKSTRKLGASHQAQNVVEGDSFDIHLWPFNFVEL